MSPFFIFIIAIFILSALLRIEFFFTILYLFVGIYFVFRLWSEQTARKIIVKRDFYDRAFVGDAVQISLYVKNGSRLPIPWLMISELVHWSLAGASSIKQVISLKGKENRRFTYELRAKKRGYYKVGPTTVYTGDLLGLRPNLMERLETDYLVVYPKILPLVELGLPSHSPQAVLIAALPIFEDTARITSIREYCWSDNPRHIHWPATAGTGKVMIKKFRPAIARESAIFLNLVRDDYNSRYMEFSFELAITTAASLAYNILIKEKLPVGFFTVALDPFNQEIDHFDLPPVKEKSQLAQILEILARIQPIDSEDFLRNLRHKAIHLSWGATVMVITGRESDVLLETLFWLKHMGVNPILILVDKSSGPERSKEHMVPTFEIQHEKDIETWGLTI
jgi:uncharacterized protein (DUF58 family)